MRKPLFFLTLLSFTLTSQAQIAFEEGYFIDNSYQRIDCLIRNVDWKNNPTSFKYKFSENGEVQTIGLDSVREFGIGNLSKYLRETVEIDKSSNDLNELSSVRAPIFTKETLFLKAVIEGKANLYLYTEGNIQKFFYSIDTSAIKQLVFKRFKGPNEVVKKNNRFRNQLWNDFECEGEKLDEIKEIKYSRNELTKLFIAYNDCHNSTTVDFSNKQPGVQFKLYVRPRVSTSSLRFEFSPQGSLDNEFDSQVHFGLGAALEFIAPFNKNKWAFLIEPTFQGTTFEKTNENGNVSGGLVTTTAEYYSMEVPIGVRHYFFLKTGSKLFLNASVIFDFDFNSSLEFARENGSNFDTFEIDSGINWGIGMGYFFNQRFSLEARYQTGREVLSRFSYIDSDYSTTSLILGYTIVGGGKR